MKTSAAADRLASLLGLFEGADVTRTRRLIEVVRDRNPDDPVVVALVGPSGAGKSYLVNAWAGSNVAPSGALRPTTKEPLVVGTGSGERFRGFATATTETAPPSGVVLIDTPPWEHDHEAVDAVLDASDLAILVVSPSRYADATTAEAAQRITARGVTFVVAVNRLPDGAESIVAAVAKTGWDVPIVVPEERGAGPSIESLSAFLHETESRATEIATRRRAAAAPALVEAVEGLAAGADDRRRAESELLEAARARIATVRIVASRVAAAGDRTWPAAAAQLAASVDAGVGAGIARFKEERREGDFATSRIDAAAAAVRTTDPGAFDTWQLELTVDAVDAIRPRLLRRFRRGPVSEEIWRLALDPDRRPSRRTRRALGARLSFIRELARDGVDDVLGEAVEARAAEFCDALAGHTIETGDRLRDAVAAVAEAAGPGAEEWVVGGPDD